MYLLFPLPLPGLDSFVLSRKIEGGRDEGEGGEFIRTESISEEEEGPLSSSTYTSSSSSSFLDGGRPRGFAEGKKIRLFQRNAY